MNPILRNTLAAVAGVVAGSALNMALVMAGSSVVPPPEGTDLTTMEGLTAAMPLMKPVHFLMPFLAHALGTLAGAFLTCRIAVSGHLYFGLGFGLLFFIGGAMNVAMLPSPLWFNVTDLALAYFPMGYLGYLLGKPRASSF